MKIPKTITGIGIMGIAIVLKWQAPFLPFMGELFWAGAGMAGIGAGDKIRKVINKQGAFESEKQIVQKLKPKGKTK